MACNTVLTYGCKRSKPLKCLCRGLNYTFAIILQVKSFIPMQKGSTTTPRRVVRHILKLKCCVRKGKLNPKEIFLLQKRLYPSKKVGTAHWAQWNLILARALAHILWRSGIGLCPSAHNQCSCQLANQFILFMCSVLHFSVSSVILYFTLFQKDVIRTIVQSGGIKHLVTMATSEHVIMQNEALVALALIAALELGKYPNGWCFLIVSG